ncbi:MAG: hypothetical protein JHC35_01545, partial [Sulfuricurvum sp.]|uniref:hypothetical protein n=1 Tax=Sulfuricurvum sp. TaxID=2025608 RepID=UPI0025E5D36C
MKTIIADTNVWYAIGTGKKCILDIIKTHNGKLCATPISLFEIMSKIDESNFELRKNAAIAVLNHADRIVDNNEAYMERYFGCATGRNDHINWKQGFITISKANSIDELMNGFTDYADGFYRKCNIPFVKDWRNFHYKDFRGGIIKSIENNLIPKYIKQMPNGQQKIAKLTDPSIIALFDSSEYYEETIKAIYYRMMLGLQVDKRKHKSP